MNYDIAVVGSGCAGGTAALYASRYAKVVVIERKTEVGTPVKCAECVAEFVINRFKLEDSIMNKLNKLKFFIDDKSFTLTLPVNFCIIDKSRIQKILVERALKNGCDIILGETVTGLTKNGLKLGDHREIISKIIIGADGVESRIARFAGMNTGLALKDIAACVQHTVVDEEELDCLEVHTGNYAGYGWVFPKGNGLVNAGVGTLGNAPNVADVAKNFLSKRFRNFSSIHAVAGCVPLALPKALYKDNIILVGDAGRLVNPLGGGGIQNALLSGKLGGTIAGNCISEKLPVSYLRNYELICKNKIYPRLKRGYKFRNTIVKNPLRLKKILALAELLPEYLLKKFINSIYYSDIDETEILG